MSQILAMAKRLQEAERIIDELRGGNPTSPEADSSHSGRLNERAAFPRSPAPSTIDIRTAEPSNVTPGIWPEARQQATSIASSQIIHPGPDSPSVADLSIDEHGKISYYGPTSAVHDPPHVESPRFPPTATFSCSSSAAEMMRNSLVSYTREMALWEDFSLRNGSLQTGIPQQLMSKLLHVYWTWVSPMFMWVYRPAFIRTYISFFQINLHRRCKSSLDSEAYSYVSKGDMATGGRYYSEFLLTVICAHAAKYQDGNSAEFLLSRARRLLGTAIQQPSSIPTVQALLQLSARDLAQGSISQAWVYSGIAFRMASDLGLQHSNNEIKGLSAVDLEIRRRLFWGCYFWDKYASTLSYLGKDSCFTIC
jgi:hypothetical protein